MRRTWLLAGAGALSAGILFAGAMSVTAPIAGAAPTPDGCRGGATSRDADNDVVDRFSAPGEGGTQSDPFEVDSDGTVEWEGSTDDVIQDGEWKLGLGVSIFDFLSLDGDIENADALTEDSGRDKVDDRLPVKITGLFKVEVELTGAGGAKCSGAVWVRIGGSPIGTPLWFAGGLLAVLGVILGYAAMPKAAA